jgi:hypothetical protein
MGTWARIVLSGAVVLVAAQPAGKRVRGVPIQAVPGTGRSGGWYGVGVAGEILHVAEWHARVQRGGYRRSAAGCAD